VKKRSNVTNCDNGITFALAREIITCMISHDDLGLVPWKSTGRSTEFQLSLLLDYKRL